MNTIITDPMAKGLAYGPALSLLLARDEAERRAILDNKASGAITGKECARLLALNSRIAVLRDRGVVPTF